MHLLVTGGAGFIGSNFVHYLLENTTHSVTTLDALTYAGSKSNLHGTLNSSRHRFVKGKIQDRNLVSRLIDDVDAIVNFAAESHVDRSITDATSFVESNVYGTQALLEEAGDANIDRFVQVSTDEVYGETLEGRFSEEDPLNPRNPYAATKAGADLLARSYYITHDVPVLITRSSNNFGPRQHHEKFIPKFIIKAAKGERLPLYGDGSNVREWTYVADNCRAIHRVLTDGELGETYNIGTGVELSNLEVARRILEVTGVSEDLIEFVEDRPGHDQRYALETDKIENLGWEPQLSFDEGLERTVEFYLS